jgi:NADPH2:quinone reductase
LTSLTSLTRRGTTGKGRAGSWREPREGGDQEETRGTKTARIRHPRMKAYVVEKLSPDASMHQVKQIPNPMCPPDGVLVKVIAAGLNFFDLLMIDGKYQYRPKVPFVPGSEWSGIVLEVGPELSKKKDWVDLGIKVGDEVFGQAPSTTGNGAFCQQLAIPNPGPFDVLPIPQGLTHRQAASIRITYTTAYHALVQRGNVKKGEWVLIHAAAGGVGSAAIHVAKSKGCIVIATCGSQEKAELCKNQGADYVIDYSVDKTWWETVKSICKKADKRDEWGNPDPGVDVVYDVVGLVMDSMRCTCYNARILLIGFTGRSPTAPELVKTNLVLVKGQNIMHVTMGGTVTRNPGYLPSLWSGIFDIFENTHYRPVVYPKEYTLDTLDVALKELGARKTYGKVVVMCDEDEVHAKL